MSAYMPNTVTRYHDYRLSHHPVHVNRSDFQSFIPAAVSAGWFPAGPQPVVALDIVTDVYADHDPPSGLLPGATILPLLQAHYHRLCFHCDSGEYTFTMTVRPTDHPNDVQHISLLHTLAAEGDIAFGFALSDGIFVVTLYSNESSDAAAHAYDGMSSVVDVTVSGPLIPDSSYIGIHSVSYIRASVVQVPG
jgi:hypothetical protein